MPYPLVQDFVQEYENLERCQNEASLHHVHSKRTASSCCTSCCKVSSLNRDNAIEIILVPYVQNHMVRHARRANSYGKYIIYTYIGSFFKASVSAEELSSGKCPFSAAQRGYYFSKCLQQPKNHWTSDPNTFQPYSYAVNTKSTSPFSNIFSHIFLAVLASKDWRSPTFCVGLRSSKTSRHPTPKGTMWLWFKIIDPQQKLMAMRLWFMIMLIMCHLFAPFDAFFDCTFLTNLRSSLNKKASGKFQHFRSSCFTLFHLHLQSLVIWVDMNFPKETPWNSKSLWVGVWS